jgi:hypothetical protein
LITGVDCKILNSQQLYACTDAHERVRIFNNSKKMNATNDKRVGNNANEIVNNEISNSLVHHKPLLCNDSCLSQFRSTRVPVVRSLGATTHPSYRFPGAGASEISRTTARRPRLPTTTVSGTLASLTAGTSAGAATGGVAGFGSAGGGGGGGDGDDTRPASTATVAGAGRGGVGSATERGGSGGGTGEATAGEVPAEPERGVEACFCSMRRERCSSLVARSDNAIISLRIDNTFFS